MVRQHPVTKRSRRGSPLGGILLLACIVGGILIARKR